MSVSCGVEWDGCERHWPPQREAMARGRWPRVGILTYSTIPPALCRRCSVRFGGAFYISHNS